MLIKFYMYRNQFIISNCLTHDQKNQLDLKFIKLNSNRYLYYKNLNYRIFNINENQIILIEEPEVHLHPKLEADLADLIIYSSNYRDNQFFIETHSEDFLFLKNEVDNGNLTIDGKTYHKPSMYVVKQIMTQNEFTDNLLFDNYNVEQNTVRFILHKIPPDAKGIENKQNSEFLSMISEYLCEKN